MRPPPARATTAIIAVTAVAWLLAAALRATQTLAVAAGFIPARLGGLVLSDAVPVMLTPLTATLVHGGLTHIAFNMLILGYCGRYVEVALGPRGVIFLYVIGAYAAAAAQYLAEPGQTDPMIGASGAVSALLAAYAILFGQRRAVRLGPIPAEFIHALWLAAAWIGFQLLIGYATAGNSQPIAIAAHVGGFLAGLVLARPLLRWRYRKA